MFWILVIVFGGVSCGTFGLPMKFCKKWKWENIWSVWSVWTLLLLPWVIGFLTVPKLLDVYSQAGWGAILPVFICGFLWGVGAIAYGMGLHYLGLGLGTSLMVGLIIAVGAVLPLFTDPGETVFATDSIAIIIGVWLIISRLAH